MRGRRFTGVRDQSRAAPMAARRRDVNCSASTGLAGALAVAHAAAVAVDLVFRLRIELAPFFSGQADLGDPRERARRPFLLADLLFFLLLLTLVVVAGQDRG